MGPGMVPWDGGVRLRVATKRWLCDSCCWRDWAWPVITTIFPRIYARTYYAQGCARVMSFRFSPRALILGRAQATHGIEGEGLGSEVRWSRRPVACDLCRESPSCDFSQRGGEIFYEPFYGNAQRTESCQKLNRQIRHRRSRGGGAFRTVLQ
jgi:hypothetical protein